MEIGRQSDRIQDIVDRYNVKGPKRQSHNVNKSIDHSRPKFSNIKQSYSKQYLIRSPQPDRAKNSNGSVNFEIGMPKLNKERILHEVESPESNKKGTRVRSDNSSEYIII